jgi:membrane protease YdiL (CAAX protease family)
VIGRASNNKLGQKTMNAVVLRKGDAAWHGALFLAAVAVVATTMPGCPWPWYLLLPLLLYAGIAWAVPPLRRTAPRLTIGRIGGAPLACAVALSGATAAVLVGFHLLARPQVTALAANLPIAAFANLALAGVCFSFLNAVLEELVFRGVLWEAVVKEWNATVALAVTAALFGLSHFHGYPPGLLGIVLASLYGVALGLLRWWAGGLGLAVACHISADATIFSLLLFSGAFERAGS